MAKRRRGDLGHRLWEDPEVDELAAQIDKHLARLERDPKLNPRTEMIYGMQSEFDNASAKPVDKYPVIGVRYWGWGPRYLLKKAQAKAYLRRLDKGFAGRHDE